MGCLKEEKKSFLTYNFTVVLCFAHRVTQSEKNRCFENTGLVCFKHVRISKILVYTLFSGLLSASNRKNVRYKSIVQLLSETYKAIILPAGSGSFCDLWKGSCLYQLIKVELTRKISQMRRAKE